MNLKEKFFLKILTKNDYSDIYKHLIAIKDLEFSSKDKIAEIRKEKFKKLLEAANKTRYWQQIINGTQTQSIEEFPVLTKAEIRANEDELWNRETTYVTATTGGTTGKPLVIRRNTECQTLIKAWLWNARFNYGLKPSSKILFLNAFSKISLKGRVKMRLGRKRILEAFPSNNAEISKITSAINHYRPEAIEGYVSGILSLTKREKIRQIPLIITTGEMLFDHQRSQLETFFNAKVRSYYGSNEIGSIAFECEKGYLHINETHVHVETINDKGEAVLEEEGKVVVTDLDNYTMPFIRYELGDRAILTAEPCACGRQTIRVKKLLGRNHEFLSGIEGRQVQATQLSGFLKDLKSTGELQFVQKIKTQEITINYTGQGDKCTEELRFVQEYLQNALGATINIQLHHQPEIEKTSRGKQQLVVKIQ